MLAGFNVGYGRGKSSLFDWLGFGIGTVSSGLRLLPFSRPILKENGFRLLKEDGFILMTEGKTRFSGFLLKEDNFRLLKEDNFGLMTEGQ